MSKFHVTLFSLILFASGLLGGAISGFFMQAMALGSPVSEKLVAKRFELVDENGNVRGGLSFAEDGPVVFFNDKEGVVRAYLGVNNTGPVLAFRGSKSEPQLVANANSKGEATLGFFAGHKSHRLILSYLPTRGPVLSLFDENNTPKVFIGVGSGKPTITLLENGKRPAIAMLAGKDRGSLLGIWDSQGKPQALMGLINDVPMLYLYQKYQTGMLFRTTSEGKPGLALLDNGAIVWSAAGGAAPTAPDASGLEDIMREVMR
jgi:hypothetical protein